MSTFSESATTALALIVSFDTGLWTVVGRSLAVSATACAIACGIGLVAGAWLAVARFGQAWRCMARGATRKTHTSSTRYNT